MEIAPRKNIRLAREEYVGRRIYFVTACVEQRARIFQDGARANAAIEELKKVAAKADALVHAFCVMPDHVHLLLEGRAAQSDLVKFVAQWKQSTGYIFRHELPKRFWQRRFYDHVLRNATDSEAVAWYIWMNPVRKGIVSTPEMYPFSGSFTVEWPRIVPPKERWSPPWKGTKD
jgi:REP-associated tyrosine transposase